MFFYYLKTNITIGDIADVSNFNNLKIDRNAKINSFLKPSISTINDLTFYNNSKYQAITKSTYIITSKKLSKNISKDKKLLISNNIDADIARLSNLFYRSKNKNEISKLKKYIVGSSSNISNKSIINNGVVIGKKFFLDDYSSIGHSCLIGNNVRIGKNVSLSNAIIGDNVSISDGTRIGQPGFGFANDNNEIIKIFHIGRVIIQDDVSIGANCTIDRGSFSDTIIGEKTHIDNLVHIAHNVVIGNNCIIAGQCGFAGSAEIGNFVHVGGQCGIAGHIQIGDNVKIAAKSGVIRNVSSGEVVMGYPAIKINKYLKNYKKMMIDL